MPDDAPNESHAWAAARDALAGQHVEGYLRVVAELGACHAPDVAYRIGFLDALIWAETHSGLDHDAIMRYLEGTGARIAQYQQEQRQKEDREALLDRLEGMTIGSGLLELDGTDTRMFVTRDGPDSFQFSFETEPDMVIHGTMFQLARWLKMSRAEVADMATSNRPLRPE